MFLAMTERARTQVFMISLMLSTLVIRLVLGAAHPDLNLEQTALIGVTTVLLLAPPLYQFVNDKPLIRAERRIRYGILTAVASVMFVAFVAL